MISRQNIASVISKGTAKQKSLLIVNNFAEALMNQNGFLSDSEVKSLLKSLQKPSAIRKYNKLKQSEEIIRNFLSYLQQLKLVAQGSFLHSSCWAALMLNLRTTAGVVNIALESVPDLEKAGAAKSVAAALNDSLFFALADIQNDAKISIITKSDYSNERFLLSDLLSSSVSKFSNDWAHLKTALKIVNDYMNENDVDIKVYKEKISEIESWTVSIVPMSMKLISNGDERIESALSELFVEQSPLPDYESLPINNDFYSYLKEYMFLW